MVARARAVVPANVRVHQADVLTWEPPSGYDAVVSVAALHHLPREPALERLASFLRPGGVLAAVALPKVDVARELGTELVSAVGHRVIGAGRRLRYWRYLLVWREPGRPGRSLAARADGSPCGGAADHQANRRTLPGG